jgi:nicotinamide-nucleotide amidase
LQAEIITIGDEILIGQITDTNSKWIAERLNEIGVGVYQITSIQDDKSHILKALAEAENNADIIILTGGLGPTKDDITKKTLAEYFDDELVVNESVVEHIKTLFGRIKYKYTPLDIEQAMLPKKALALRNDIGTASGMWFAENGKVFVSLPGVPNEMKGLVLNHVLPKLQESYKLPYILHKTILTYGMGESTVAVKICDWEDALPSFIKLAFLPSYGKLRLRLSARGTDKTILETALAEETIKLQAIIGNIIIGYEEKDTIEVVLQKMFNKADKTLAVAESCTGGDISKMITSVAGASKYFNGGVVAYSAKAKEEILHVSGKTIDRYSVVSKEVAKEMALNCRRIFNCDYAIATTGNAGPTTDKTDKSVGIVFIAIASENGVLVEEFNFGQPRERVIQKASIKSLEMLQKEFLKNNKNSLLDM